MTRRLPAGEVMALAPDDASRRAASSLARPGPWSEAGCDDRAAWGRCRGSARAPYDVACDLADFAYRCTCPSQKQPCKHVLALLLLWAAGSAVVAASPVPADVAAWLAARPVTDEAVSLADRLSGQIADSPSASASPAISTPRRGADPEAAAARAAQRADRVAAGMAELDLWIGDLLRAGLASAASQPYSYWDSMASRLVDAQAPAVASTVRDLASLPYTGEGWPARLLGALARMHLLAAGWARYGSLPDSTRADLRTAAGWAWPVDAVLSGEGERDRWYVLARVAVDDPQLRVQRTWLWGMRSKKLALLLDFARPGAAFGWQLWPGEALEASVARYPGSAPLRVVVAEQQGDPAPAGQPPGWDGLAELAAARATAVAADPWTERWPVSVRGVVPSRHDGRWVIRDLAGRQADLFTTEDSAWKLAALSGGRPVQVLGEWHRGGVNPLGVWAEERMVVL